MSSCLERIIGIKAPCADAETPLSNMYLTDYPGISLQSASNIADEKTLTGYNYLVDLRRRAMQRMSNDILAYINREYRASSIITNSFQSGEFRSPYTKVSAGTTGQRRGIVVANRKTWCRFYKMVVNAVRIYSNYTGDIQLKLTDVYAGVSYPVTVSLEAGVNMEYVFNQKIQGTEVQITIPSDVEVYSIKPECGCGGKPKNDYLEFNGLNNGTVNTSEGYGIQADISVVCDFSSLICDMATSGIIGQAAFELCGAMFYDEATKNNRLNYLTIYKAEELKDQAKAGFINYTGYMNDLFSGLRNFLVNNDGNCGCIDCGSIQVLQNI